MTTHSQSLPFATTATPTSPLTPPTAARGSASYEVSLLQGAEHFDTLRQDWTDAVARMDRPSIFITPHFVETSWKFLSEPTDQAWFVVIRQRGQLVGLLPLLVFFVVSLHVRVAFLPTRCPFPRGAFLLLLRFFLYFFL